MPKGDMNLSIVWSNDIKRSQKKYDNNEYEINTNPRG